MKLLKYFGILFLIVAILYLAGPHPSQPAFRNDLPAMPADLALLEKSITAGEATHKLKPGNEARIIWQNDSLKQKTAYAIVYLHGFGASQGDGDPLHTDLAKKFGCNLYLSRLAEHGLDTSEALLNCTAGKLWNSAKEAYAIGRQLGDKVIILSTSTGGTLALMLAAEYPEISGLLLISPNIAINDPNAWVANNHWGVQVARLIKKGNYNYASDSSENYKKYWYPAFRLESVAELEELIETTMKESIFKKVTQPVLMLYYYKDKIHQDPVVKVSAMKKMFDQLGTPENKKRSVAIPNAGSHAMGSYAVSHDVKTVEIECEKFLREVLLMKD